MPTYKTDLRDIYFNLLEHQKTHEIHKDFEKQDIQAIIEEFDKFVAEVIWPTREKADQDGTKLVDGQVIVPDYLKAANDQYFENGWFGLGYPEEIGGIPAPFGVLLACNSLMTGANVAYSVLSELNRGAMNVILKFGSEEMKAHYVPQMISGQWVGTMCLTEAGAGSDVGALRTSAIRMPDGRYKINGTKLFITAGDHNFSENIVHLVLAKTPDAPKGTKGISLFLVKKYNDDGSSNDVLCNKVEEKMGIHASPTCELIFGADDNCYGEIIGEECTGMAQMFLMMNEVRLLCGVQGESQANLAYMLSESYARERVQFKTEIINLPDVKRMLLKMRAKARGLRALNFYVAKLIDQESQGENNDKEIALLTPISKAYCTDEGFNIASEAVQVHGGYGYMTEYGVEQFIRDTKIGAIYEGTNGIQAMDFVGRKVLKDNGEALQTLFVKILKTINNASSIGFDREIALLKLSLSKTVDILSYYEEMSNDSNMDAILGTSVDFLNYISRIIVAWLLLEQAMIATSKIDNVDGEDKEYYRTKIDDYKFFTHQELALNAGLFQTICVFRENYKELRV